MAALDEPFNEYFGRWGITLPLEDVVARRRGKVVRAGWAIWYLFGSDERGEFLDVYAAHRMTSDMHTRFRADGTQEGLPTLSSICFTSRDPVENARLEAEFYAKNRAVAELLGAKGFGLAGDEPPSVIINRYLLEHPDT